MLTSYTLLSLGNTHVVRQSEVKFKKKKNEKTVGREKESWLSLQRSQETVVV